jgi:hypothetical protein
MLHPTEATKPPARRRPAAHRVSSARTALATAGDDDDFVHSKLAETESYYSAATLI